MPTTSGARVVILHLHPQSLDGAAAKQAIVAVRSQLADLPVQLRVDRSSPGPTNTARALRILTGRGGEVMLVVSYDRFSQSARLYVASLLGQRVLRRSVKNTGEAGRFEALGLIIRSAVRAVLRQEARATQRSRLKIPVVEPPVSPRPARRPGHRRIGLELAYQVQLPSADPLATHGIHVGASFWPLRWLALVLSYRAATALSRRAASGVADARIVRHPFTLGFHAKLPVTGPVSLGGRLSATADYTTLDSTALAPGYRPASDSDAWLFTLGLDLHLSLALGARVGLFVAIGWELWLNGRDFAIRHGDEAEVVIDPWPLQPRALLGLRLALW